MKTLNFSALLGVFLAKIDFRLFESWTGNNTKKIDDVRLNRNSGSAPTSH
ncbi:hypothetical protein HCP67_001477 [Salmonella enterica subsp. enterica serovar Saintpaul]|nr:hypothetical protein [Salmonella enterica subsp. enterica serovar Saintpaul]EGS9145524.1 hypothetical protein [Salmonella enterica]ELF1200495.1 hypothetical protein [Salmonella enterica]